MLASLTYLLHPYVGDGYQFWSGIGSDAGELTLVTMLAGTMAAMYHAHRCTHCRRIGRHPVTVHTEASPTPIDYGAGTAYTPAVSHTYRSCRKHLDHNHAAKARE